ncbi:YbhB/YbcL family Raf kinase inhibitor-like protein [Patescibacteria group bacterium]|nr:YbhB/YbcL family Raf kinase inhibitor-like protein [Patescibacteria group bacterium]
MRRVCLLAIIPVLIGGGLWGYFKFLRAERSLLIGSQISPTIMSTMVPLNQMKLTSLAFNGNQMIPALFTCDGQNIIPPLQFSNLPDQTQSLSLTVVDPDSPSGSFTHWIVFNIDPQITQIQQGEVPLGASQGVNSAEENSYFGPCPNTGTHHYVFTLYALDSKLNLPEGIDLASFLDSVQNHILTQTQLVGIYRRK